MMKLKLFAVIVIFLFSVTESFSDVYLSSRAARGWLERIIKDLERNGPQKRIIDELDDFLEIYPYSDVTDEALLKMAHIYLERRDYKRAARHYEKILEDFSSSKFRVDALFGIGYCRYRGGHVEEAKELLTSVVTSDDVPQALKERAEELLTGIDSVLSFSTILPNEASIGAIFPLSGKFEKFGADALRGLLLAAKVFGESHWPVDIQTMDLSTDPQSMTEALIDLSGNRRVVGVVGLLPMETALPVASSIQQRRIPLIALSQKSGVPQTGDYVFRNFITPVQQAEALADYALNTLGLRRFAVLHPENSYGSELASSFKEEVRKLGGLIVGERSYGERQFDFSDEIKSLFGIKTREITKGKRNLTKYARTFKVDALFIPDYYDVVRFIAPFLAYYDINDITLLGSNGWNSPKLAELAGEYVEGAVFVDGFFSGSGRKETKEFVRRFKEVYEYEPGILEAQAYDAAIMLFSSLGEDPVDRDILRERLMIMSIEGTSGKISFDSNGEARKELLLLTVKNGEIVELR